MRSQLKTTHKSFRFPRGTAQRWTLAHYHLWDGPRTDVGLYSGMSPPFPDIFVQLPGDDEKRREIVRKSEDPAEDLEILRNAVGDVLARPDNLHLLSRPWDD